LVGWKRKWIIRLQKVLKFEKEELKKELLNEIEILKVSSRNEKRQLEELKKVEQMEKRETREN